MKTQTRTRTLLLEAGSVLSAIPNGEKRVFTHQERLLIAGLVLDEITFTLWSTVSWFHSMKRPPYQGMAFVKLKELLPRPPSDDDLRAIIALLTRKWTVLFARHGLPYTLKGDDTLPTDFYDDNPPRVFDHGVRYHWHKDYLQATWLRPVIDFQEMSVTSFMRRIAHNNPKAGLKPDQVFDNLQSVPLCAFLTTRYQVEVF